MGLFMSCPGQALGRIHSLWASFGQLEIFTPEVMLHNQDTYEDWITKLALARFTNASVKTRTLVPIASKPLPRGTRAILSMAECV